MSSVPRGKLIAVALKSWANFSRHAVEGILRFGREHGGYQFRDVDLIDNRQMFARLLRLSPAGAILSLNARDWEEIRDLVPPELPLVNLSADRIDHCATVCNDDQTLVKLAIRHLHDTGYSRLAWLGWQPSSGSARREEICRKQVAGLDSFRVEWLGSDEPDDPNIDRGFRAWVRSLRTPIGVVVWNARIAMRLRRLCAEEGLRVPEDIGILSLSDEQVCLFGEPALSAMDANGYGIGYQAMSLIAAMLAGKQVPLVPVMVKPTGILQRESTGKIERSDDAIDTAVKYIEANACSGITVENVVATITSMGRTRFYALFTERVGRSPADQIRRVKITKAKQLLSESQLSVTRISGLCGFGSGTQFGIAFKRETGLTPLVYRRQQAKRDAAESKPKPRAKKV